MSDDAADDGRPADERGADPDAHESGPAVRYQADPPAAVITLNRPRSRNPLSTDVLLGIHAALDMALDDPTVRAVILTGEGSAFCSGLDLREAEEGGDRSFEEISADADALARLLRRLRSFEKVTIAAVNGPALASGCALATLCDFTLAVGSARFGYPEVRRGFVPAVVAVYLRGLVNDKQLRDLLLTGRIISADEAKEMGLVNEVLPSGELLAGGREIAERIAENAPVAIQSIKELLEALPGLETDRAIKAAVEVNARMRDTDECREGIRSFLEKRAPDWLSLNDVASLEDEAAVEGASDDDEAPSDGPHEGVS